MEIQRADLAYRRRVTRTLIAVTALLLAGAIAFQFWLHSISARLPLPELVATIRLTVAVCVALTAASIAALGAHLWLRGNLIVRGRRFPPRDVRSVRDMRIREGVDAVRVGRASQTLGALFVTVAALVALAGWLWLKRF